MSGSWDSKVLLGFIPLIIIALSFGAYLDVSLPFGSSSGAGNLSASNSSACMIEVPSNSTIDTFQNSTVMGYLVTYSNGSKTLFPAYFCPSPVHSDLFDIASTVEESSQFIAAENGTTIPIVPFIGGYSTDVNGSSVNYAVLHFILFSNTKIYPCGPQGYWSYEERAIIQVVIPIAPSGTYIFSSMTVQRAPQGWLNDFHCTTTTNATMITTS